MEQHIKVATEITSKYFEIAGNYIAAACTLINKPKLQRYPKMPDRNKNSIYTTPKQYNSSINYRDIPNIPSISNSNYRDSFENIGLWTWTIELSKKTPVL